MNLNESALSAGSSIQPTLGRVVSNVVDMQQQLVTQFQSITAALESLKLEHNSSVESLREDLRRTDDRSQRQIDELRTTHRKEVERLMDFINVLLEKNKETAAPRAEAPRPTPSQQAFAAAASPGSFFGAGQHSAADMQQIQRQMLMQQDPQMQMRMMLHMQQQAQMQAAAAAGAPFYPQGMAGVASPAGSLTSGASAMSQPFVGTPKSVPQQQPLNTVPAVAPPVPKPGTVNLPIIGISKPAAAPTTTATASPGLFTPKEEKPLVVTPKAVTAPATTQPETKPAISFGGFKPATPTSTTTTTPVNLFGAPKTDVKPVTPVKAEAEEEEDKVEEFEPQVDFKPVVPLPELVEVVTGEESEETLFESRSKLFIFFENKEWKERGLGIMKILKDPKTGRSRIVMRREQTTYVLRDDEWLAQVHKVCCNAPLAKGMTVKKMPKTDKAVVFMCEDFSEEEQTRMNLSAKFSSAELADEFIKVFEKEVAAASAGKGSTPVKETKAAEPKKAEKKEEKKIEEKKVEEKKVEEKKVEEKKEEKVVPEEKKTEEKKEVKEAPKEPVGFGDQFKMKEGEWDCSGCYSRQKAGVTTCPSCGTNKDGSSGEKDIFSNKSSILPAPAAGAPKFSFGLAAAAAAKEDVSSTTSTPAAKPSLFGAAAAAAPKFSFGASVTPGSSPASSVFGGSKLSSLASATGSATTTPSFSFGKKDSSPAVSTAPAAGSSPSVNFSFKPATAPGKPLFGAPVFGAAATSKASEASVPETEPTTSTAAPATTKVFGSGLTNGLSFSSVAKSGQSIFDKENVEAAQKQFASLQKSKPLFSSSKPADKSEAANEDEEGGADEEYEPDVQFTPAVPLPDLVEVVTGEEDEETMFKARCKLYRFVPETKENKERGVGDMKILKTPSTGKYRVVMRREQVFKLCANFRIAPSIELKQKPNMPNVYQFVCMDYAEEAEGSNEVFTVKFKNEDIAKEFYDVFVKAQKESA